MHAAALIAERLDMLDATAARRQSDLLQTLGLPLRWQAPADAIVSRLALDKKRAGSRQRWVLAEGIGAGRVRDDVPPELAREAIVAVTSA
jgi:3-dehydroquinate synthetase